MTKAWCDMASLATACVKSIVNKTLLVDGELSPVGEGASRRTAEGGMVSCFEIGGIEWV